MELTNERMNERTNGCAGLAERDFKRVQYSCVEHPAPEVIPAEDEASAHHLSAVISSCPYMPIRFRDLVR